MCKMVGVMPNHPNTCCIINYAGVAELADARDFNVSCGAINTTL